MKTFYEISETKVDLLYATIKFDELTAKYKPTFKRLQAYLKETPETKFQEYYDLHKNDYTGPASFQIKRIRVAVPFKASPAKKEDARKKINEVATLVTSDNFDQMARTHSDDEYAIKGGLMGWVVEGVLEKALENAVKSLQEGQISPPIETPFGFFLVQLLKKRPAEVKALAEVKMGIAEKLLKEKHQVDFREGNIQKWNEMLAEGRDIKPQLKRLKLQLQKTGSFSLGAGAIPKLGSNDAILDAVFSLSKKNPRAKKLLQHQNTYYYIELASIQKADPKKFKKEQLTAERNLKAQLQQAVMREWTEALRSRSVIKEEIQFAQQTLPFQQ